MERVVAPWLRSCLVAWRTSVFTSRASAARQWPASPRQGLQPSEDNAALAMRSPFHPGRRPDRILNPYSDPAGPSALTLRYRRTLNGAVRCTPQAFNFQLIPRLRPGTKNCVGRQFQHRAGLQTHLRDAKRAHVLLHMDHLLSRSRKITSIANSMPMVWTPCDGTIHNPRPARAQRRVLPRRPISRLKYPSATLASVARNALAGLVVHIHLIR